MKYPHPFVAPDAEEMKRRGLTPDGKPLPKPAVKPVPKSAAKSTSKDTGNE